MIRGDAVVVRRYSRPGKPARGDVPTITRGTLQKAVSGRVWVLTDAGESVVAWRRQVRLHVAPTEAGA